ncbi:hypothetical protein [Flavimarina sp. Hel_I_48]|uniref:hypothetical protein n=1 Tax=Flavimarina sp. Hel_I_48 TaxID=1392488 RepID=UPI0004DF5503|nr:hypothetical protein [Flavimarina sp. Hel_I_48]
MYIIANYSCENAPFIKKRSFTDVFLLFMAIFCCALLQAQDIRSLEGKILNDSLENSYLHIMNLNLQRGTITREDGSFSIPARLYDTLYISALQFEHQKIVVNEQIFEQKSLIIALKAAINELKTVNISDIDLSGRLDSDAKSVEVIPYFDQTNVGFAPTSKKRSSELRALQGVGGFGLGGLISMLNGDKKMQKKIFEISIMEGRVKKAQVRFNNAFYVEHLNISENLIDDFCYFVYENDEAALQLTAYANPLKLIRFLKQKAILYRMHKALPD